MNSQFAAGAGDDRRSSVPLNPIATPPFPGKQQSPYSSSLIPISSLRSPGFTGNLAVVPPPPSMYALEASRMLQEEVQRDLDPHRARAMAERLLEVQLLGLLPPPAPAHPALSPAEPISGKMWGSAPPHPPAPCLPWAPARAGEMMALPHYHPALHPPQAATGDRPLNNQPSFPIHHHPKGTVLEMLKVTDGESLPPTNGSSHLVGIAGRTTVEKAPGGQSGHTNYNALDEEAERYKITQQMGVTNMVEEGDAHSLPSSVDHICFMCGEVGHKMNLCPLSKEEAKKRRKDENKKREHEALAEGNAPFRPFTCFKCGIYGHRQIDCVASNEEIEKCKNSHQPKNMKVELKEKKKKRKIELKEKKKMMKLEAAAGKVDTVGKIALFQVNKFT